MTTLKTTLHRDSLVDVFKSAEHPRQLVGIEHEKVSFKKSDGSYVPYAGRNGIRHFLLQM